MLLQSAAAQLNKTRYEFSGAHSGCGPWSEHGGHLDPVYQPRGIIPGLTIAVQVASFGIVVTHIKQVWDDIFTGHCEFCKGTGIVTCKHVRAFPCCPCSVKGSRELTAHILPFLCRAGQCKGTKTLRKEAAQ